MTYHVQRGVELERLAEHYYADFQGAGGTIRGPRVDSLVAVILERPGLNGIVQSAECISHRALAAAASDWRVCSLTSMSSWSSIN